MCISIVIFLKSRDRKVDVSVEWPHSLIPLWGSYTFSKFKFKHFWNSFKVHFQAFPALLTVVNYMFTHILEIFTLNKMLLCY